MCDHIIVVKQYNNHCLSDTDRYVYNRVLEIFNINTKIGRTYQKWLKILTIPTVEETAS